VIDPRDVPRGSVAPLYQCTRATASYGPRSQEASQFFVRDEAIVIALADGGGGMRAGGTASHTFVQLVGAALGDPKFPAGDLDTWLRLFRATDVGIATHGGGETTGILVSLGRRGLIGVSTGDSRAWMVMPATIDDLTAGQYTRQRLGSNHATPTVFERSSPAGVLLVATDGLFKFAAPQVIAGIVRDVGFAGAAETLVALVRRGSGAVEEDVSVILARRIPPEGGAS
jgi:serine/threonine protein phosphatase PrpC